MLFVRAHCSFKDTPVLKVKERGKIFYVNFSPKSMGVAMPISSKNRLKERAHRKREGEVIA